MVLLLGYICGAWFTIGSEKATKTILEVSIICVGYVAFSIGSAFSLWKAQDDLCQFAKLIMEEDKRIVLNPLSNIQVISFQAVMVAAVVAGVFIACVVRNSPDKSLNQVSAKNAIPG